MEIAVAILTATSAIPLKTTRQNVNVYGRPYISVALFKLWTKVRVLYGSPKDKKDKYI